jgi:hypothetical protein
VDLKHQVHDSFAARVFEGSVSDVDQCYFSQRVDGATRLLFMDNLCLFMLD